MTLRIGAYFHSLQNFIGLENVIVCLPGCLFESAGCDQFFLVWSSDPEQNFHPIGKKEIDPDRHALFLFPWNIFTFKIFANFLLIEPDRFELAVCEEWCLISIVC